MSQIIDLGNSGIHFAESGVIDLGGRSSGIQIIGPPGIASKYLLKMSGVKDLVSKNSQTDTSAGATGYIDASNTYVAVSAETPLITQRGNTSVGTFEQFLTSPLSPASQTTDSLATGEYFLWLLGTGSVAVSANTATITGAGNATEATGVNFQVTVAGTVDIAITGECTHFQLTDGNVSLYPIFHNAVGVVPDRSGTTKLADIDTDFSKFRDSLGGEADGVELITNGNFTTSVRWTLEPGWTISHGVGAIYDGVSDKVRLTQLNAFTTPDDDDAYLELKIDHTFTDNGLEYLISASDSYVPVLNGEVTTRINKSNENNIVFRARSAGGPGTITNISVKKISPAAARHSFTWTPGVDYTDHTTVESIMTPSDSDGFLKASAAGGFELSDGTNTLRWPPTVGDDIPRSYILNTGTPTINGDIITLNGETTYIKSTNYWTVGKSYRVNATVSDYIGSSSIYLAFDGSGAISPAVVSSDGTYEFDYIPDESVDLWMYSTAVSATVTVNSIYELAPYQFEADVEYLMEIVYGFNEALDDYKMELNVLVPGTGWISVIGDFDKYFEIDADFILGLENPYQSSVKGHVTEKLQQYHWRPTETIPDGYSLLTSDGEVLTSGGFEVTSNNAPIYAID